MRFHATVDLFNGESGNMSLEDILFSILQLATEDDPNSSGEVKGELGKILPKIE